MLFIWNGMDYQVVDDKEFEENSDEYKGYVITRRLIVTKVYKHQNEVRNYDFNLHSQLSTVYYLFIFSYVVFVLPCLPQLPSRR